MKQQPVLQALEGICQKKRALSKPLGREKGNGPQHLSCFPLWCRNTQAECQNRTGCLLQSHKMTSLLCPFLRQTVQTTVTAFSCRPMHIPLPCKEGSDHAGEASQIDTLWNRFFFSSCKFLISSQVKLILSSLYDVCRS